MSTKAIAEKAMEQGKGILRLTPTWVPRVFCVPGRRIKLHPDDYYALGGNRGGIDERWFSSTTPADNGPLTSKNEGLSHIAVGDGDDAETLLKNADMAMYQAKEKGSGNFQGYSPLMGARALERLSLENDLRRAMDNGEFALYYQPVLDVASGAIGGVEALIRWQHPWRGLVGPGDFLDLVEIIGLSDSLDMWVMETACRQMKEWQDAGLTQLRVAVNLSARPFHQRDLVDRVERVLRQTGLSPQSLELEITETLAMQRAEVTLSVLERLKTLGVRVSIDDFGVGYSSLSYLRTFPIDTVKIDRSFVRDLTVDPSDAAIAAAVIAMAHSLNLEVVAEGVEGEEQLRFLEAHGCDRIQGYLLSPPKPAEECLARILEHREEVSRLRSLGGLSAKGDGAAL